MKLKAVIYIVLAIVILFFNFSCSLTSQNEELISRAISGKVHKGPVKNSTVSFYQADGRTALIGDNYVDTDERGYFIYRIPSGYQGLLIGKAVGGIYIDEADKTQQFNDSLVSGVFIKTNKNADLIITPISNLIYELALIDAGNSDAITEKQLIEKADVVLDAFGMSNFDHTQIWSLDPVDLSEIDDININNDSHRYALLNSVFTQTRLTRGFSIENQIDDYADDLYEDGKLDKAELLIEDLYQLVSNTGSHIYDAEGNTKLAGIENNEKVKSAVLDVVLDIRNSNLAVGQLGELVVTDKNFTITLPNTDSTFSSNNDNIDFALYDKNGKEYIITGKEIPDNTPKKILVEFDTIIEKESLPLSGISFSYTDKLQNYIEYSKNDINAYLIAVSKIINAAGNKDLVDGVILADLANIYEDDSAPKNGFPNIVDFRTALLGTTKNELSYVKYLKAFVELSAITNYPITENQYPFSSYEELLTFGVVGELNKTVFDKYLECVNGDFNSTNRLNNPKDLANLLIAVNYFHKSTEPASGKYPFNKKENMTSVFGADRLVIPENLPKYEQSFANSIASGNYIVTRDSISSLLKIVNYNNNAATNPPTRLDYSNLGITLSQAPNIEYNSSNDYEVLLLNSVISNLNYEQVNTSIEIAALANTVSKLMQLVGRDPQINVSSSGLKLADLTALGIDTQTIDLTFNDMMNNMLDYSDERGGRLSIQTLANLREAILNIHAIISLSSSSDTGISNSDRLTNLSSVEINIDVSKLEIGTELDLIQFNDNNIEGKLLGSYSVSSLLKIAGINVTAQLNPNDENIFTVFNDGVVSSTITVVNDMEAPIVTLETPTDLHLSLVPKNGILALSGKVSTDMLGGEVTFKLEKIVSGSVNSMVTTLLEKSDVVATGTNASWAITTSDITDYLDSSGGNYNVIISAEDKAGNIGILDPVPVIKYVPDNITQILVERVYSTTEDGNYSAGQKIKIFVKVNVEMESGSIKAVTNINNTEVTLTKWEISPDTFTGVFTVPAVGEFDKVMLNISSLSAIDIVTNNTLGLDESDFNTSSLANAINLADESKLSIDTVAPKISSIALSLSKNNNYSFNFNEDLNFTVKFDSAMDFADDLVDIKLGVTIDGIEYLADAVSTTTDELLFTMKVGFGLEDNDGIEITKLKGNILDTAGNKFAFSSTPANLLALADVRIINEGQYANIVNIYTTLADGSYNVGTIVPIYLETDIDMTADSFLILQLDGVNSPVRLEPIPGNPSTFVGNYIVADNDNTRELNVTLVDGAGATSAQNLELNTTIPDLKNIADSSNVMIDTIKPIVKKYEWNESAYLNEGQVFKVTAVFDTNVTLIGQVSMSLNVETEIGLQQFEANLTEINKTHFTFSMPVVDGQEDVDNEIGIRSINIIGAIVDDAGNSYVFDAPGAPTITGVVISTSPPKIENIFSSSTGSVALGENFELTLEFSKKVRKGGSLLLTFVDDRGSTFDHYISFNGIAPSSTVIGTITVPEGFVSNDLNIKTIIQSVSPLIGEFNNQVDPALPINKNLADNSAVIIDSLIPKLTSVVVDEKNYKNGSTIEFKFNFDEAINAHNSNLIIDLNRSSTDLTSQVLRTVPVSTETGSTIIYTYTVTSNDENVNYDGIKIVRINKDAVYGDNSGNEINMTTLNTEAARDLASLNIDGKKPSVVSVSSATNGIFYEGQEIEIQVELSEPVQAGSTLILGIVDGSLSEDPTYTFEVSTATESTTLRGMLTAPALSQGTLIVDANVTRTTNNSQSPVKDRAGNLLDDITTYADALLVLGSSSLADNNDISLRPKRIPKITSITSTSGHFLPGQIIEVSIIFDFNVTLKGLLELNISLDSGEVLTTRISSGGDGLSNKIVFEYIVQGDDNDATGIVINALKTLNSSTLLSADNQNADLTINANQATIDTSNTLISGGTFEITEVEVTNQPQSTVSTVLIKFNQLLDKTYTLDVTDFNVTSNIDGSKSQLSVTSVNYLNDSGSSTSRTILLTLDRKVSDIINSSDDYIGARASNSWLEIVIENGVALAKSEYEILRIKSSSGARTENGVLMPLFDQNSTLVTTNTDTCEVCAMINACVL